VFATDATDAKKYLDKSNVTEAEDGCVDWSRRNAGGATPFPQDCRSRQIASVASVASVMCFA
jgi:hypothetical protein